MADQSRPTTQCSGTSSPMIVRWRRPPIAQMVPQLTFSAMTTTNHVAGGSASCDKSGLQWQLPSYHVHSNGPHQWPRWFLFCIIIVVVIIIGLVGRPILIIL